MAKKDGTLVSVFKIFFQGTKLYLKNFGKFFKHMAFPVLGQILGIALIFFASYIFTLHVSQFTAKSPVFDNIALVFAVLLLLTLPGFFVFCKAFWDYLVAMASLNSMASTLMEDGELDDLGMHTEFIKRRAGSYVLFLLLISLVCLVGSFPLLWVILAIVLVYLSLSFQVFAIEEDKSAFKALATSVSLVKFNFIKTLLLLILLYIVTYLILPGVVSWIFKAGNLVGFFSYPVEQYIRLLPISDINSIMEYSHIPLKFESYAIAKTTVLSFVSFAVVGFTLPLRSICCTCLYREIYNQNYAGRIAAEKLSKRAIKRKNIKDDEE